MASFKADPVKVAIGVGVLSVATFWAIRKITYCRKEKIPEKWRKVGQLSELMCFPIKSAGVIRLSVAECTTMGLKSDWLRDRFFMVVTTEGAFMTARQHPKLILIQPRVNGHQLILVAPNMENLIIDLEKGSDPKTTARLFGGTLNCQDCGEDVAKWFSRYLLGQDTGMRLVHSPQDKYWGPGVTTRGSGIPVKDSGAFPDYTSFNLISESSMDDLNSRLAKPVAAQQFRPNILVSGPKAFEEDYWEWVKIGDVIFKVVKQCDRCILTTVDAQTGEKDENEEPLTTLKTYRLVGDPKKKIINKIKPVLGIHIVLRKPGSIKLGDIVEVA